MADIDAGARPLRVDRQRRLAAPRPAGAGPGRLPGGDDCLQSNEMATGVGLAVDKNDTVCRDWLQAVNDEVKNKVTAAESDPLKGT
jgi:hypothetical protein